ncbi:uncharacterized protein EV420DRAFT_1525608 [Desarmillaria tabescens]|uniref:Uncharacterized protein n=1 Tax=Armillaria tabescens TaxID=1929756 RepID=A0AA39NBL8_ARMTA|nr:uncharacterized protein EV420DRAFT_1525608 [Desarmillaria tabescens]KAK0462559.1 hypothetical protein EV420DRAFT_1525608 [Desarmillaria tabescens]
MPIRLCYYLPGHAILALTLLPLAPMPRRARTTIVSTITPSPAPRDQFHHSIPRFILRRFHTGPRKSKAERRKEYQRTHIDPDHVFYYDLASGSLDVRSIGTIYGLKNLYRDASNPSNVNELEEKLSVLERDAAVIIEGLHSSLSSGKAILKRHDLQRLRKFLFIMHYRKLGVRGSYFNPDHPTGGPPLRSWLECYKTKHQCQTHTDVWLHVLRYYLDTPHPQILNHAQALYDQHGREKVDSAAATHIDPNFEHYEAVAYYMQAEDYFLCIWEANAASEFILTSGFGLWEGISGIGNHIHRIFVVSPRIAVVLRSVSHVYEGGPIPVNSSLLKIRQEKPTVKLVNGESAFVFPEGMDQSSSTNWNLFRLPDDLFTFPITKLSLSETDAFNNVLLANVKYDGAITFLGKERMLRTIRVYDHEPVNKYDRQKFISLMRHLSVIPTVMAQVPLSCDPVDAELYAALMGILLNEKPFISRYNRALSVFQLVKNPSLRKSCIFVSEHIFNFHAALQGCQDKFDRAIRRADFLSVTLEPSLSEEVSLQVFEALDRFVLDKFNVRLTYDTSDVLGQVGKEVMLIAFLDWVIDEAVHVLDKMPVVMRRTLRIQFP